MGDLEHIKAFENGVYTVRAFLIDGVDIYNPYKATILYEIWKQGFEQGLRDYYEEFWLDNEDK